MRKAQAVRSHEDCVANGKASAASRIGLRQFPLTLREAAGLLNCEEAKFVEQYLRSGVIRSRYYKTKGLRINSKDVSDYIAHLQGEASRDAKACRIQLSEKIGQLKMESP